MEGFDHRPFAVTCLQDDLLVGNGGAGRNGRVRVRRRDQVTENLEDLAFTPVETGVTVCNEAQREHNDGDRFRRPCLPRFRSISHIILFDISARLVIVLCLLGRKDTVEPRKPRTQGLDVLIEAVRLKGLSARAARRAVLAVRKLWKDALQKGEAVELPIGLLQPVWAEPRTYVRYQTGKLRNVGKPRIRTDRTHHAVRLAFRSIVRFEDLPNGDTRTIRKSIDSFQNPMDARIPPATE
jgi:hypothetical protein